MKNHPGRRRADSKRFRKAAQALQEMSATERIQMLVEAGLMKQDEADHAKARYQQSNETR